MLFNSLPTIKSGNIPMIMLATHGETTGFAHPFAWTRFYPGTKAPCVTTKELKGLTYNTRISFDVWLPTPTVPYLARQQRRLFVAWSCDLATDPDPDWNDDGLGEVNMGGDFYTVCGPRFQVLGTSVPSRRDGEATRLWSATPRHLTLSAMTPDVAAAAGGEVTEILGIKAPAEVTGACADALCHLRVQAPFPYASGWKPYAMRFYLRGLAVDQW